MVKVNADLVDVLRERDSLISEVSCREQELEAMKKLLQSQRAKERYAKCPSHQYYQLHRNLHKVLAEASSKQSSQKKEFEKVISKQRVLEMQLVQCNNELALLYEQLEIQHSVLIRGML